MNIPRSILVAVGVLVLTAVLVMGSLLASGLFGRRASTPPEPPLRPGPTARFGPVTLGSEVAGHTITALECTDQHTVRVSLGGPDAMQIELASPLDDERQPPFGRATLLVFYNGGAMPEGLEAVARSLIDLAHAQAPTDTEARVHDWLVEACAAGRTGVE